MDFLSGLWILSRDEKLYPETCSTHKSEGTEGHFSAFGLNMMPLGGIIDERLKSVGLTDGFIGQTQ